MDDLAMTLLAPGRPLAAVRRAAPAPGAGEVLLEVSACGVCRTDLHIVDGELPPARTPLVPGHEVVGRVAALGPGAGRFRIGERVGVPWLGGACGHCGHCGHGRENLCDDAVFTGYHRDGGYARYAVADERFCLAIPEAYDDAHAAPLLCAGLIGYRAYAMAPGAARLGLYGFGAAAHLVAQVALADGREVFAFTRPGDARSREFARSLGCQWAGDSDRSPPAPLDAALLFAPVGSLVPAALAATAKAGVVVCAGIHMSDIPAFPYRLLWGERVVRSVANLTRADGEAFMALAGRTPLDARPVPYPLERANEALDDLRRGAFDGAAVLLAR
ncbi:MAG: zinc-dependent alcohol dehydrogenase family protein [Betaproteobacteria bacterium]|nr:zinc-dependent alcohol dehydrogenase family protein [Betaproteobacteria bacterium]PWB59936.1 MAG: alcohol dehydrogenase [Betaproteobacteria bacterium]